ncbi:hypothetical protein Tco_0368750 [Tanacetum coccineum]
MMTSRPRTQLSKGANSLQAEDLEEDPAPTGETSAPPAPKTAKQLAAKSLWEAIKSRFGGNEESKKMQKNVLNEMKRSSSSTSTSQNLAFLSSENICSTNEVSTASRDFRVSTAGGISQVPSTPCANDATCSFFAQPTTSPQHENEDFQQIDEDDLEELDLRWQVAMLTVKGILLGNVDLEGIKGKDLMVTMAGAMHQQMNLHHRHWWLKMV